ncbi:carboxyltransferase domain-containing protein [Yoonia sp. BS5-3]|uniref:Allophanate hydrolase subunit 1 n=1 Tax=Yoonia phaeophyticola TaxID=3137369 RepID=A0ABZ2V7A4_9RHOB
MPTDPELLPLGIDGILVRFAQVLSEAANAQALAFKDQMQNVQIDGVTEVASSLTSVRIGFDPAQTTRAAVMQAIRGQLGSAGASTDGPRRIWRIPAAFGPDYAPQLAEAATLAGISRDRAIAEITGQITRVIAIGFAPGQPYLGMLPDHWDIPRQSNLTDHLPRGALICAVRQLIIWGADAPTGWRHIGQTAFRVYLPETGTPFAFEPGDAVQFTPVSDSAFQAIKADSSTNGGARCEVLR